MKKKVIVAEDSNVIQNLTRKILSQLNYEVISVKNGQQVLNLLAEAEYDLLLLDIHMPVMDGVECAKHIRSMEGNQKDIPILAITGNAYNHSEAFYKEIGIQALIPKPLNYDLLVEEVKKLI